MRYGQANIIRFSAASNIYITIVRTAVGGGLTLLYVHLRNLYFTSSDTRPIRELFQSYCMSLRISFSPHYITLDAKITKAGDYRPQSPLWEGCQQHERHLSDAFASGFNDDDDDGVNAAALPPPLVPLSPLSWERS